MKKYIIVGQGIAGSLVAHFLLKSGHEILVIDQAHHQSASKLAAGIINPITGRNFVKSWLIDELMPFAIATYQELSELLQVEVYHQVRIIRALFSNEEENNWIERSSRPTYESYVSQDADLGDYEEMIRPAFAYGELKGGRVVEATFLNAFQQFLIDQNALKNEAFDYEQLQINSDSVRYKNEVADGIIFCEGFQMMHNPYFNYLPLVPTKGDILIVRIKNFQPKKILKYHLFIVPMGNELYWVGSNYNRNPRNYEPTAAGKQFLKTSLEEILKVPYEIVAHQAGIRPTTKDRRLLLGVHPKYANVFVFNGLGAKGASLAPYWAHHFVEYLQTGKELDREVDIRRLEI